MDAEKALSSMGSPWTCRWTLACFIVVSFMRAFISSWNFTAIVFLGAVPSHHCRLPSEETTSQSPVPAATAPAVAGHLVADTCYIYTNTSENNTGEHVYCPNGWEYEGDTYSMVNEWDLVCDRDYLADLSQVIFILGMMLGALFLGHITDRFGRKRTLLCSTGCVGVLTLACAWVPDFYMLLPLKFAVGLAVQGVIIAGFVFLMELFPNKDRCTAGSVVMGIWGVCMLILACVAYFLRHWRHQMTVMALPCLLAIPAIWLCQESIPWLLANDKLEEAGQVLRRMARWNGREIDPSYNDSNNGLLFPRNEIVTEVKVDEVQNEAGVKVEDNPEPKRQLGNCQQPEEYRTSSPHLLRKPTGMFTMNIKQVFSQSKLDLQQSAQLVEEKEETSLSGSGSEGSSVSTQDDELPAALQICKNPRLRLKVLVLSYAFICISLSFFSLSLNTGNLAGNVYVNFTLSGLMEVPACVLVGLALRCLGRKRVLSVSYVVGGLLLWLTVFIPATATDGDVAVWATVCVAMMSKFFCTMGYGLLPLYCVELFPTTIRSFCLGTVVFMGRIGTALAPMSTYMTRRVWWFTGVTSGTAAISAGLLLLLLPETRGCSLPQNVREMDANYEKKKTKKSAVKI